MVDLAPIDFVRVGRIAHDIFIVGRTAGMLARQRNDGPVGAKPDFMALQRLFIKLVGRKIGMDRAKAGQAKRLKSLLPWPMMIEDRNDFFAFCILPGLPDRRL